MSDEKIDKEKPNEGAMASPLPAGRGQMDIGIGEDEEPGQPDPADITSIRHGAQAFSGRIFWSANRMAVSGDALGLYEQLRKADERRSAQEARELAHLAQWNAQMTTVGGVAMTNQEAQEARQHVIDNADACAQRAIDRADIDEADKEAFKHGVWRKKELEDKRGRGTMTDAEAVEARELELSRVGRAIDLATRDAHQSLAAAPKASASAVGTSGSALDDYALFQAEAPVVRQEEGRPAPVAPAIKASGLNL